ncbi:MAG: hypothetical protein WBP30_02635 [Ferruginibacter sp.]|nr:hypothetical protein [Chitinophagaceae bacterium]
MKSLNFLSILLIFTIIQCNPVNAQNQIRTLVGRLENDSTVLTVDIPKMLSTYNSTLLKMSNIDAKFSDISIKTTNDKQYFLVFKGSSYVSSFLVIEEKYQLFAYSGISCTTSDCASEQFGCTPKVSGVACWPCSNKGKCTKTVSNRSLID